MFMEEIPEWDPGMAWYGDPPAAMVGGRIGDDGFVADGFGSLKGERKRGAGKVVEKLAEDLQNEFPGMQGWSSHNLWRMRKFYLMYEGDKKLAPLVQEISWSHNVVIMEKLRKEDPVVKQFYMVMSKHYGWTRNLLDHHIDKGLRRNLLGRTRGKGSSGEKQGLTAIHSG
jgi:predicted nuclease of restriction endonuclease-like (RecB) superfamily